MYMIIIIKKINLPSSSHRLGTSSKRDEHRPRRTNDDAMHQIR
jgi:hypothetical protein